MSDDAKDAIPRPTLSHDERLRLEALGQAIAHNAIGAARPPMTKAVLDTAAEFETFIRKGKQEPK